MTRRHSLFTLFASILFGAVMVSSCQQTAIDSLPAGNDPTGNDPPAPVQASDGDVLTTGSGLAGPHYNLNLIGVPKTKTADLTGDNGHRIFLPLAGTAKILLSPGDDFGVLDANGTDGTASFQLPAPDPDNDGVTAYSVFARALGRPGGHVQVTTCGQDPTTGEEFCSIFPLVLVRSKGKSTFTNVSKELLFVFADVNGDGVVDRIPLFDSRLQGYFWDYDNTGLKLAQLRFYLVPTTVSGKVG